MRPSGSFLVLSLLRGILDAILLAVFVSLILFLLFFFAQGTVIGGGMVLTAILLSLLVVTVRRTRMWSGSGIRITTERILLQYPASVVVDPRDKGTVREKTAIRLGGSLFGHPLKTIKWNQYQESSIGHRNLFDLVYRSAPLSIRYGSQDAQLDAEFPALPFAYDLKHYMDKVDAALRQGQQSAIRPFVLKKRGERG